MFFFLNLNFLASFLTGPILILLFRKKGDKVFVLRLKYILTVSFLLIIYYYNFEIERKKYK